MTELAEPRAPKRPQPRSGVSAAQGQDSVAPPPSLAPRAAAPRPVRRAGVAKQQVLRREASTPDEAIRNPRKQSSGVGFRELITAGSARKRFALGTRRSKERFGLRSISLSVRLIAAVTVAGFLGLSLIPVGLQWYQQQQEQRAVVAQIEQVRARNAELENTLAAWEDPDYIATQARSRLGFAWPGEIQYSVVGLPEKEEEEGDPFASQGQEAKPWPNLVMQSMLDADTPAASSSLTDMIADGETQ